MGMKNKLIGFSAIMAMAMLQNEFYGDMDIPPEKPKKEGINWDYIREYNLIQKKKSHLSSTKRRFIVRYVEILIKEKEITLERVKQEI